MANMYEALSCSSSTSPAEADDISVFLRQILLRSSSSSSTLMAEKVNEVQCLTTKNGLLQNQQCPVQFVSGSDRMISLVQSSSGLNSGAYFPVTAPNVSSSSVGTVDNDIEEYDCESEEGLLEEAPAKAPVSRSSSKRGRAAEVHNLSEKRRRCRINEKMKALQNLIPNSNKTDKASMLDEAIEYLKQLQLQVQMLTMRNGLSLYPMSLPGAVNPYQLPQMKMAFNEGNGSLNMIKAAALPVDQDVLPNTLLSLPDHYTIAKQTPVTNNLSVIDSTTSFGIQSSHVGSFQLPGLSKGICGEETLSFQRINEDHSSTSMIDYHIGNADTGMKEINTLQACLLGRYQSENSRLKDLEREAVMLPQMHGMSIGRSALIKSESSYF